MVHRRLHELYLHFNNGMERANKHNSRQWGREKNPGCLNVDCTESQQVTYFQVFLCLFWYQWYCLWRISWSSFVEFLRTHSKHSMSNNAIKTCLYLNMWTTNSISCIRILLPLGNVLSGYDEYRSQIDYLIIQCGWLGVVFFAFIIGAIAWPSMPVAWRSKELGRVALIRPLLPKHSPLKKKKWR